MAERETHVHVTNIINNRNRAAAVVQRPPRRRRPKGIPPFIKLVIVLVAMLVLLRLLFRSGQDRYTDSPGRTAKADGPATSPATTPATFPAGVVEPNPDPDHFTFDIGSEEVRKLRITRNRRSIHVQADSFVSVDFGSCHSSPTVMYDCESDRAESEVTISDMRHLMGVPPSSNSVRVTLR